MNPLPQNKFGRRGNTDLPRGVQTRKLSGLFAALIFASFALSQQVQAVSPPPDGGYPGGNTAEGQLALGSLTMGAYNTGLGLYSLLSLTTAALIQLMARPRCLVIPQTKIPQRVLGRFC